MEKQQPDPNQIQVRDGFAGGEYTNAMTVGHTKEEFLLTFLNIIPPSGRVVGKMITSPGHLKRIIRALDENLKKYEASFGKVQEAEAPKSEIGFKTDRE
jgi:hypothetical protein